MGIDIYLCNGPWNDDWCILRIGQKTLGSVVNTEEGSSVNDDTLHRHTETSVQTEEAVWPEDLSNTVEQTLELTISWRLAYISSQSVNKIQKLYLSCIEQINKKLWQENNYIICKRCQVEKSSHVILEQHFCAHESALYFSPVYNRSVIRR